MVADVFDRVNEVLILAVVEVARLPRIMINIDDPPVLIVAARDAGGRRRPEIIEDMSVKGEPSTGRQTQVPHTHVIGFRDEHVADGARELVFNELLAQLLRPMRAWAVGRARRSNL